MVKPRKSHVFLLLKQKTEVFQMKQIEIFVKHCTDKFTNEELESFYMELGVIYHFLSFKDAGYFITQRHYEWLLEDVEKYGDLWDLFREANATEIKWRKSSFERRMQKLPEEFNLMKNIQITPKDVLKVLQNPKKSNPNLEKYILGHMWSFNPEMKVTREHLSTCLRSGKSLKIFFFLLRRCEEQLTINELCQVIGYYSVKKERKYRNESKISIIEHTSKTVKENMEYGCGYQNEKEITVLVNFN